MIILAVDYGDVRTGLAICDKNEILSTPMQTVTESYAPKLIEKIKVIAAQKGAELIVVGKPVNMDGSEGERARKCMEFAAQLQESSGIQTEMFDERMTTMIAASSLNVTNTRGQKRKNVIDALSAQIILQNFIDLRKK
ncbi:MAG: Holliday junction resolvase RuvX [Ruminococcaceae bacterium]|nr:Holliday junction resolvase RuvX [Oscillospiraceae bacterium]